MKRLNKTGHAITRGMTGGVWLLALGVFGACRAQDIASEASVSTSPSTTRAEAILRQSAASARRVTPAAFLDGNPMGWVGRAHNRFLDEVFAELKRTRARNVCRVMERVLATGTYLGKDSVRISRADRARLAASAVRGARCGARNASMESGPEGSSPSVFTVATVRRAGDPSPYFDAISSATDGASNASALASTLSALTSSAAQDLDGDALDAVNAVASVAVSSMEYWDANLYSEANALAAVYGDCMATADSPESCLYMTGYRRAQPDPRALVRLAAYGPVGRCGRHLNGREIGKADVTGAITGFFTTGGNPWGALAGAFIGSGAESAWQFGNWLWCAFR